MNICSYIHERGLITYRRKMKIEKVNEFLFFNNEFEDIVDFTNFLIKQNYSAAVIKMNIMTASKRINKPNDISSVVDTYTDSISENELNINIQKCKEQIDTEISLCK